MMQNKTAYSPVSKEDSLSAKGPAWASWCVLIFLMVCWYVCNATAQIFTKLALSKYPDDKWAFIDLSFVQTVVGIMLGNILVKTRTAWNQRVMGGKLEADAEAQQHERILPSTTSLTNHSTAQSRSTDLDDNDAKSHNEKNMITVAVCHATGNLLTNLGIHLLGASGTQVLKVAEPVFTVVLARFLTNTSPNRMTLMAVALICGGLICAVSSHTAASTGGVLVVCVSNFALPLRNITVKKMSSSGSDHADHGKLFLESVRLSIVWIAAALLIKQHTTGNLTYPCINTLLSALLTNGYHIFSLLCLEQIDPISHSIANVFKRVFTIVSAFAYFHEPVGVSTLIGLEIAFSGLFLYTEAKTNKFSPLRLVVSVVVVGLLLTVAWASSSAWAK